VNAGVLPRCWAIDRRGEFRRGLTRSELEALVRSGEGRVWLDLNSRRDEEWLLLHEVFRLHPLAVEDTRSPGCRVKLEEYEGYLFVVVRELRLAPETPEPYDVDASNLYLFLGPNYVVTVHGEESGAVETMAERVGASADALARGVDYVAYLVLDGVVDLYFPLLDEMAVFVDELEDSIFQRGGAGVMERVFELKRTLLVLRRHITPAREVMAALANRPNALLKPETQVFFRDIYDHVVRQVELLEGYRDLASSAMEAQLTMMSNHVNEIMKALSVIATIVLPPTLVASIYGMNFDAMPGLGNPAGFWFALAGMVLISLGFLVYMWRKGWL